MNDPQNQMKIRAAQGYLEIGMVEDALRELESLPENEQMSNESLSVYVEIFRETGESERMEKTAQLLCQTDKQNVKRWLDCALPLGFRGKRPCDSTSGNQAIPQRSLAPIPTRLLRVPTRQYRRGQKTLESVEKTLPDLPRSCAHR
jgi:hypothetical protein